MLLVVVAKTLLSADRIKEVNRGFDASFMLKSVKLTAVPNGERKFEAIYNVLTNETSIPSNYPRHATLSAVRLSPFTFYLPPNFKNSILKHLDRDDYKITWFAGNQTNAKGSGDTYYALDLRLGRVKNLFFMWNEAGALRSVSMHFPSPDPTTTDVVVYGYQQPVAIVEATEGGFQIEDHVKKGNRYTQVKVKSENLRLTARSRSANWNL